MGAPKVIYQDRERGVLPSPFNGITVALAGEFETGPVNEQFVTSREDFLRRYSKNNAVPLNGGPEYFSALAFLEESNSLLLQRVVRAALHSGVTASDTFKKFIVGYEDPAIEYDFANNPTVNCIFYSKYPTDQDFAMSVQSHRDVESIADVVKFFQKEEVADDPTHPIVKMTSIQQFALNEQIEFTFEAAGKVISDGKIAEVYGTNDLSAGYDWFNDPQKFQISINGNERHTIELNVKCGMEDGDPTIQEHIEAQLELAKVEGVTAEAKTETTKLFIGFKTSKIGRTAVINLIEAGTNGALTTLGILPGGYYGTDKNVTKKSKIGNIEAGVTYYVIPLGLVDDKYEANLAESYSGAPINWVDSQLSDITPVIPGNLSQKAQIESDCFVVDIFRNKENFAIESYICSLDKEKKDGFGNSLFVEDVLDASSFIFATVSPIKASSVKVPPSQIVPIEFYGGSQGTQPTAADRIKKAKEGFLKKFYDIFIILDGGFAHEEYAIGLVSIAKQRGDCVVLLNTPIAAERSSEYLNRVLAYRRYDINLNTDVAELFSPHLSITDEFNNRSIMVGNDGYVGARIAYTARNFEVWYPVGGESERGQITVNDTEIHWSEGEMDILDQFQINPIWFEPGRGIKIWNQKTLKASASLTQFANVKFLELYLKRVIMPTLRTFLFELNTAAIRIAAYNVVSQILRDVESRDGVYGFNVVCDVSNNPEDGDLSVLHIDLIYKPVRGIREVRFIATKTSTGDLSLSVV